jgi:ABC-type cobalamin/Fe3+-siderophores transport system ATPase subunit
MYQQLLSMIYRRNKVSDGTIKMSDTEEHSLQNKTGTINITTVNVDKIHFKNLLIVSGRLKGDCPTRCHSGETGKGELTSQTAKNLKTMSQEIQGDQKFSVHLMITIQKVTSNVQSVPRQSPDIY